MGKTLKNKKKVKKNKSKRGIKKRSINKKFFLKKKNLVRVKLKVVLRKNHRILLKRRILK